MGESVGLEAEISALLGQFQRADVSGYGAVIASAGPPSTSAAAALDSPRTGRDHPGLAPGSAWPHPPGHARWRLSAGSRTLTRLSDDADLADIVGEERAEAAVGEFLKIRPSGGRVFVDEFGNAVTPIENQLIFLGMIGVSAAAPAAPSDNSLRSAVINALLDAPGSTAREIAYALRRSGLSLASKSEINSLIYRDKATFKNDGGATPRWRVVPDGVGHDGAAQSQSPTPSVPRSTVARRPSNVDTAYRELIEAAQHVAPQQSHARASATARPAPALILSLFTWQREAIAAWYANGCHGIVEAVTGTGKTLVGLEAVAQARRDGEKSTVLVPSVDLQDQWVARFETFLPDIRVARIGGRASGDPGTADVTIAVVNSALRHNLSDLTSDSLLVADEVHRYGAEQFQYALRANYKRRLGLTATLERSGDDAVEEVLTPYFGGSILKVGFDRAIREGVVAPFRLVMAPVVLTDEEQAEYDGLSRQISNGMKVLRSQGAIRGGGSNIALELGRLRGAGGEIGKAARMAETAMRKRRQFLASVSGKLEAIEELSEMIGRSQGSVIFTQSKEVAESAAWVLREWGVPASALHSDMNDRERRQCLQGLDTGRLQALAAPKLLDEGIDVRTVDLGIVMTASRSRRQMVQRLGRVIRRKDDGRAVNFVILFAQDTVEDPSSGAHEGFFDLVGEVASNKVALDPGWTANAVLGF